MKIPYNGVPGEQQILEKNELPVTR